MLFGTRFGCGCFFPGWRSFCLTHFEQFTVFGRRGR